MANHPNSSRTSPELAGDLYVVMPSGFEISREDETSVSKIDS